MRLLVTQAQDLIFELLSIKISDLLGSLVFVNFEPDVVPTGLVFVVTYMQPYIHLKQFTHFLHLHPYLIDHMRASSR